MRHYPWPETASLAWGQLGAGRRGSHCVTGRGAIDAVSRIVELVRGSNPASPCCGVRSGANGPRGMHFTQTGGWVQAGLMFVIELTYKADLGAIDAHMAAHMKFLKKYYTSGHFLMSGRKVPRDGGIILAVGESRTNRSDRPGRPVLRPWPCRYSRHRVPRESAR